MPSSPTDLCNHALAAIGITQLIADINESSNEARLCLLKYADTRDDCLAEFDWSFARRYVDLAATTYTPPAQWLYAYAYPSDAIRVLGFPTQSSAAYPEYSIEYERYVDADGTQLIASNLVNPTLAYTQRNDAVAQWPARFQSAVIYAIAAELAMPLTKSPALAGAMVRRAAEEMDGAKVDAARERYQSPPLTRLIAARTGVVGISIGTPSTSWFRP